MNVVLLDTSVASLLHPGKKRNELRLMYEPHLRGQTLALSFQTVAELWGWAEANRWGAKSRAGLDAFLRRFLIIQYDIQLAKTWARVMNLSRRAGRRLEAGDCWVAATAVHHQIPLIAHDGHFLGREDCGLRLITHCGTEPTA